MCDCVSKINATLAPSHRLKAVAPICGHLPEKAVVSLIRRDNGKPETRSGRYGFIMPNYCPFCGEKHADVAAAPKSGPVSFGALATGAKA